MNPYPTNTPEWLAREALGQARGNTATAVDRLRGAVDALMFWQLADILSAGPGPEEPRRG